MKRRENERKRDRNIVSSFHSLFISFLSNQNSRRFWFWRGAPHLEPRPLIPKSHILCIYILPKKWYNGVIHRTDKKSGNNLWITVAGRTTYPQGYPLIHKLFQIPRIQTARKKMKTYFLKHLLLFTPIHKVNHILTAREVFLWISFNYGIRYWTI